MTSTSVKEEHVYIILDAITLSDHEITEEITRKAKIVVVKNLNFSVEEVDIELDKSHQLLPTRDRKQSTIVRFRSHAFKEKVYIPKTEKNQR